MSHIVPLLPQSPKSSKRNHHSESLLIRLPRKIHLGISVAVMAVKIAQATDREKMLLITCLMLCMRILKLNNKKTTQKK